MPCQCVTVDRFDFSRNVGERRTHTRLVQDCGVVGAEGVGAQSHIPTDHSHTQRDAHTARDAHTPVSCRTAGSWGQRAWARVKCCCAMRWLLVATYSIPMCSSGRWPVGSQCHRHHHHPPAGKCVRHEPIRTPVGYEVRMPPESHLYLPQASVCNTNPRPSVCDVQTVGFKCRCECQHYRI